MKDTEQLRILSFLKTHAAPNARVLDVGCGYGRNLKALLNHGYRAIGVETNPTIVEKNQAAGLPCTLPNTFNSTQKFDILLLSHVVEHFPPNELKTFMEIYLERLVKGGLVVIATPLYSPYFFDDFDHIRPYHSESLLLLFGNQGAGQMQYQSKFELALVDIWFRKSPLRALFFRGRHVPGVGRAFFAALNLALRIAYLVSFGLISRKDGWVGVFRSGT